MLCSVGVPLFGQIISFVGNQHYIKFLTFALSLVFLSQFLFFFIKADLDADGTLGNGWLAVIPIICIAISHSVFSTILVPIVNKYLGTEKLIAKFLSMLKIMEGLALSVAIYVNGRLRQATGNYTAVSMLILMNSMIGVGLTVYL